MEALQQLSDAINDEERLFQLPPSSWPQVQELVKDLEPAASLWGIANEFGMRGEEWLHLNMQVGRRGCFKESGLV